VKEGIQTTLYWRILILGILEGRKYLSEYGKRTRRGQSSPFEEAESKRAAVRAGTTSSRKRTCCAVEKRDRGRETLHVLKNGLNEDSSEASNHRKKKAPSDC